MDIETLQTQYRTTNHTPVDTVDAVYDRIRREETNAWISLREKNAVREECARLRSPAEQPLYGVPFAVKDNIDSAVLPTTAGCPDYEYHPDQDAPVVEMLRAAGGLLIGKTNMDQFASGLVGTRSPYGACRNVHNDDYISGGSSSGSAVAVARNHVAFALGTDTAGSGRVPAAFNGLVGLKPTRGRVSTAGVVPACKTLDCVSVFAHSGRDALLVESVMTGDDPNDPYTRAFPPLEAEPNTVDLSSLTVGVPDDSGLEFFGDSAAESLFASAVKTIESHVNAVDRIDFSVFSETAELLYGGPWVAERLAAIESFYEDNPSALHPVVREIIARGESYSAVETFNAFYQLESLKANCEELFSAHGLDLLITPTTGTVYTVEEIREQPIERNSTLGYYTDYVNLLDLAAVSIPAGQFPEGPGFGLTLLGPAGTDRLLATVGDELQETMAVADPAAAD